MKNILSAILFSPVFPLDLHNKLVTCSVQKISFLVLIIYLFFSAKLFCQNLYLKLNGKTELETSVIDSVSYLKTHRNYKSITAEIDEVKKTLFRFGYIENEVKKIRQINDSLFSAQIHLKKRYRSIYIYHNKNLVDNSILELVSKNVFDDYFELNFTEVENALNFINSKLSEKGFPFSRLRLSKIKVKDELNLEANLIIESSEQKRIINAIVIKGYEKISRSFLKHYLKIKPGQTFDLNGIKKKTEGFNDLKFANQIKAPEVLFLKDSTSLYLYLEKTKSNSFDGFLGFGTNEKTNKLDFDGYLNLNLTNNLNYGESFSLLYKSDENDQKTFKTVLTLPYIFKSPIGVDFSLQIFKRDSSFTTVNQAIKLHYQINSKNKFYAGITNTTSNNLLSKPQTPTIADYKSTYYSFAYQFIKRQTYSLLFPTNSKIYIESSFGKRDIKDASEKQTQITIESLKIFNLNKKNSVFLRINTSMLTSNDYFENELYRFGGINSIRGFEDNSITASLLGVINTEYRYQLSNNIYFHTITDFAYFENKITASKEKLFGYGFGFGILTKSGFFKFNYANGKSENQKFKLSNSKVHISLIVNF